MVLMMGGRKWFHVSMMARRRKKEQRKARDKGEADGDVGGWTYFGGGRWVSGALLNE